MQMDQEEGEGDEEEEEEDEDPLPDPQYGYPRTVPSKWSSCIRVFDVRESRTTCLLELQDSEAALNVCTVSFGDKVNGPYIAVSTVRGLQYWPKKEAESGFLHIYRLVNESNELELVHKTAVEGIPTALSSFQGRLLVGMGNVLRMYDLGKRKLLRKCENKGFPNAIVSIHVCADRIYVGDVQESFHYVKYRKEENQLYIFADDVSPRWLTCALHIDFDTMAGGDKFGNLYFVRLPGELSEEIEDDPTGGKIRWESSKLNGAPNKIEEVIQFHVGDILTSMHKGSLIPGGKEAVIYGTIMGCIGAFLPFTSREDVDFFSHLEMHMRQEHPPLCGRDHMAYRSAYFPVKNVIDGDLCEQFPSLPYDLQKRISEELDRTPGEIMKKLEDIRNKII